MATKKISELPAAAALTGTETVPVVQSGATVKATLNALGALGGGFVPDATTTTKGKLALAGDLGGTANSPTVPGLALKANDNAVVKLTGAQTVAGIKTFSSPPVVPDGSFSIADTASLQATLDAKAADSAVVHDTGTETIAGDKTLTGAVIVKADAVFDIRGHTGWDPNAANNDAATLAAITAAFNAGGGSVLIPRLLKISNRLVVPHGVDLIGLGGLPGVYSQSEILCVAAGSGVSFGLDTAYMGIVGSSGGISGGFTINGDGVATNPMRCAVGTRTYRNIDIEDAAQDGLILAATQNSLFEEVNIGASARDNLVFDMGAGGNHFLKCENHSAGRTNVAFLANAVGGGGVSYPLQNVIENMIMEYTVAAAGPMINHRAGQLNMFENCQVVAGHGLTTMATPALVRVAVDFSPSPSQLKMRDCTLVSTTSQAGLHAFDVGALAQLFLSGMTSAAGMGLLYKTASTAVVREMGELSATLVAPATRVSGFETAITRLFESRLDLSRGAGEMALRVLQPGDTQGRAITYGSGVTWYSAGSGSIDVDWGRKGAGLVGTGYKVVATGGIGVGNSAAATTPGTVTKKMEVFDAAGASLGFVPIYNAIT